MSKITIYRDDVWAGTGRIDIDGQIVDCPAILGPDQDSSDETYEAIEDAIADEPQDADRYAGCGEITRPDGRYSWVVEDDTDTTTKWDVRNEGGVSLSTDGLLPTRQAADAMAAEIERDRNIEVHIVEVHE